MFRLSRNPLLHAVAVGSIFLGTLGGATLVAAGAASATSVAKTALINGDSVTTSDGIKDTHGNPISLEQYAAERAGFKVTVVTSAQWSAMKAADFAKYQLLIIGDPNCGSLPTSVYSSSYIWGPVVMGKAGGSTVPGNRVVVGTDPEDHYQYGGGGAPPKVAGQPQTAGAEHLVQGGITYAGSVPGATGVYIDTSCDSSPNHIPMLNRLSIKGTGFVESNNPPCGGNVALIAGNSAFALLKEADLAGWGCSVHLTYPSYPADWQPLAVATDTTTKPTCGLDVGTKLKACGQAYVLVAGTGLSSGSPDMTISPVSGKGTVGSPYKVTVTVAVAKVPKAGVGVAFTLSGVNAGLTGGCAPASCKTDAAGHVSFTYTGKKAGADSVAASATINLFLERVSASVTWSVVTDQYYIQGLTKDAQGVYQVKYGQLYTFVAQIGGKVAPRYYYATRAYLNWVGRPWQPGDLFVNRGGGRFTMLFSITPFGMLLHPNWNIGALDGAGHMHILHIHVNP